MAVLEFSPTVGDRIILAMRKAKMTQTELAEKIHVSQSTVSRWINDDAPITVTQLQRIAAVTGQRRLVLDLVDLPDLPSPGGSASPAPGSVTDLGERRSTCIPKSAGQKVRSVAA